LNSLGINQATFYKTVSEWNVVYTTLEALPYPNPYGQNSKRPLPRQLEIFPNAKEQIVAYSVKNLGTLTVEGVNDFIVNTVIPPLARVWKMENEVAIAGITSCGTVEDADDNDDAAHAPSITTNTIDVDQQQRTQIYDFFDSLAVDEVAQFQERFPKEELLRRWTRA
jgi:hypothetical protein